ncbi:hypothetical protein EV127DRAFT_430400 [Xylaria flabelliformis]|nr:hypothetical protein EV127DRAFT_430400 [Xylaria flabelliformis]
MSPDESSKPLWKAAEEFLNVSATAGLPGALDLYEKLETALERDGSERFRLAAALSDAQMTSLRVIQEWWSFSIEHEPWFAENPDRRSQMRLLDMYPILEGADPMVVSLFFGINAPFPKISTYRLQVYRLFQMEFNAAELSEASEQLTFLGFLQEQRRLASFYAAIQRVTISFRLNPKPTQADLDSSSGSGTHILAQRPLGTSVESCPWLKFRKSAMGYPYFLWHVDKKCTVEVQNLESLPNYTCISHTWGRWRDESVPGINLSGVPWLVPRNTRFQVEYLPDRLAACFPGWYIWLDLFCIPQDGSTRAAEEIARQAEIFGNARTTIVWLNDITDWTGLRQTIRWLCEFCLANDLSVNESLNLPSDLDGIPTGLLVEASTTGDDEAISPAPWLTSLWTLQEACLRPDMILCKDDFEFLTVKEGCNTVVTLEILVALMNYTIGNYSQGPYETIVNSMKPPKDIRNGTILEFEELNPLVSGRQRRVLEDLPEGAAGVIELYNALVDSGMTSLYRLSPVSILTLGHHRQCTSSNRAEAIMSVTGATQWYKALTEKTIAENAPPSLENQLIMEFYPLDFLQEVIRNVGALFFATVTSDLDMLNPVVDTNNEGWVSLNPSIAVGSMLPFRSVAGQIAGPDYAYTETSDHPATASWLLRHDGSVSMGFAGIVSSSQDPPPSMPLQASIRVPGHFSTGISERCDLHEWVRSFRMESSCANYAVSLRQQTKKFHNGIILKQIDGKTMVKVGTFVTDEITIDKVESQLVNWIVL